eukprot:scaffold89358_cov35-Tisochrysis_lutea.AAC.1
MAKYNCDKIKAMIAPCVTRVVHYGRRPIVCGASFSIYRPMTFSGASANVPIQQRATCKGEGPQWRPLEENAPPFVSACQASRAQVQTACELVKEHHFDAGTEETAMCLAMMPWDAKAAAPSNHCARRGRRVAVCT